VFAKENIQGTDPFNLASQTRNNYEDLRRRTLRLGEYFSSVA